MNVSEEQKNQGLDVKFYPIRNRYLERSIIGLSRLVKFILVLSAFIVLVVIADFSGYALEDVKAFFSTSGLTELAEQEENELFGSGSSSGNQSLYAGHSISAKSPNEMHNLRSFQSMLMEEKQGADSISQAGYFGIDISHWQQTINWAAVTNDSTPRKIDFSIVKATQGADQADPDFTRNWKYSNENFELAGAYHFYLFRDDAKAQAQNFIQRASLLPGNLPPIVDIELNCSQCDSIGISNTKLISDLKSYLDELENHYNIQPIIYTNIPFYNKYLAGQFEDYPFWMAKYEKTPPVGLIGLGLTKTDSIRAPKTVMWQFTDYDRIEGIIGKVDMNFLPEQAKKSIQLVRQ